SHLSLCKAGPEGKFTAVSVSGRRSAEARFRQRMGEWSVQKKNHRRRIKKGDSLPFLSALDKSACWYCLTPLWLFPRRSPERTFFRKSEFHSATFCRHC